MSVASVALLLGFLCSDADGDGQYRADTGHFYVTDLLLSCNCFAETPCCIGPRWTQPPWHQLSIDAAEEYSSATDN